MIVEATTSNGKRILFKAEAIEFITEADNGTVVYFNTGSSILIKESYEEIYNCLRALATTHPKYERIPR